MDERIMISLSEWLPSAGGRLQTDPTKGCTKCMTARPYWSATRAHLGLMFPPCTLPAYDKWGSQATRKTSLCLRKYDYRPELGHKRTIFPFLFAWQQLASCYRPEYATKARHTMNVIYWCSSSSKALWCQIWEFQLVLRSIMPLQGNVIIYAFIYLQRSMHGQFLLHAAIEQQTKGNILSKTIF